MDTLYALSEFEGFDGLRRGGIGSLGVEERRPLRRQGPKWGRPYNLHVAARISLHALVSSGLTTPI